MKVALVHDYLVQYGGAERVLAELSLLFPQAPIYTLLYDEQHTGGAFSHTTIHTSFLQNVVRKKAYYRLFSFLMPLAMEQFDLSEYDLVISSSASFAKGVITREHTTHICYCHTPMRFAYAPYQNIAGESLYPRLLKGFPPFILPYMRLWDTHSAARVDRFVCNSLFIQKKIQTYYNQKAQVIYPPVNVHRFSIQEPEDYFLVVGRFLPYKRIDLAVDACNELGRRLLIVGDGPEYKRLKKKAGPTIQFVGRVSDARLAGLYARAQALIFPQEEDFGIVAIESMACGRPVIAFQSGGALEYIQDAKTGVFFKEQSVESLKQAMRRSMDISFDARYIREHAMQFDRQVFQRNLKTYIDYSLHNTS